MKVLPEEMGGFHGFCFFKKDYLMIYIIKVI